MPPRTPRSLPAPSVLSAHNQAINLSGPASEGLSGRGCRLEGRDPSNPGPASGPAVRHADAGVVRHAAEPSGGIGISDEDLLSAKQVAALLPPRRLGRKPHISTVHRWWTHGYRGVRLESIRIGGQRFTSLRALQRFFDRLSQADEDPSPAPSRMLGADSSGRRRSSDRRESVRHRRIEEDLDELGL